MLKIKLNLLLARFKNLKFRNMLIISLMFGTIFPMMLLQFFSYHNSEISMEKKVNDLVSFNLKQTTKILDVTLDTYMNVLNQIYISDDIIDSVKKINTGSESERALAINLISRSLNYIVNSNVEMRSISIFTSNGTTVFYDSAIPSAIDSIWDNTNLAETRNPLETLQDNHLVFLPTAYVDHYNNRDYYLFHMAKRMYDFRNMELNSIGTIVASIDESILAQTVNNFSVLDDEDATKSITFIVDENGNIISFPNKKFIGTNINSFAADKDDANPNSKYFELLSQASIFANSRIIINTVTNETTGWLIVNAVDQNSLFNDIYRFQLLSVLFSIFIIAFSLFVIFYVSNRFSKSINEILVAMKTAQSGELSVQIDDINNNNEISALAIRFNKMISKINALVKDVKNATYRQKEAEIRALEAQINPHFLYNTIDSINWMAIDKEEYEISMMLKTLAQILRYSINDSNKMITFREEMEWLNQYLYLQQHRFNNSFECSINIQNEALNRKIYKLLLQPFIENAIIHGFAGISSGGIIKIDISISDENFIRISIEDNGNGMDEETSRKINQSLEDNPLYGLNKIGISNVLNRLNMYYGGDYKFKISSSPGKGTSVLIIIY